MNYFENNNVINCLLLQDLRLLFSSVEKLADASAEVAFAAGKEIRGLFQK